MPEVAIRASEQDFQTPIGVLDDLRREYFDSTTWHPQRSPVGLYHELSFLQHCAHLSTYRITLEAHGDVFKISRTDLYSYPLNSLSLMSIHENYHIFNSSTNRPGAATRR